MLWTGLTISPAREEVVDFSYLFWEEHIGMLTKTSTEEQFFIFRPLHIHVWWCFIGMRVIIAVFVRQFESLDSRSETYHGLSFTRFDVCLWCAFGAMWNQGTICMGDDNLKYRTNLIAFATNTCQKSCLCKKQIDVKSKSKCDQMYVNSKRKF